MKSQDCSDSTEVRLWLGYLDVEVPVGTRNFLKKHPDWLQSPPSCCSVGAGVPSLTVKWPGHNVKHSPSFSAKVKNEWSYTSTPCLHGLHRINFTFTFYSHICDWLILKNILLTVICLYF